MCCLLVQRMLRRVRHQREANTAITQTSNSPDSSPVPLHCLQSCVRMSHEPQADEPGQGGRRREEKPCLAPPLPLTDGDSDMLPVGCAAIESSACRHPTVCACRQVHDAWGVPVQGCLAAVTHYARQRRVAWASTWVRRCPDTEDWPCMHCSCVSAFPVPGQQMRACFNDLVVIKQVRLWHPAQAGTP